MLTEHRDMLSPAECGALPSVPYPDRTMNSHLLLPPAHLWEKRSSYPSIYRMIQNYSRDKHLRKAAKHLLHDRNNKEPNLPADPRQWSREDVARWIQYITTTHHLPTVHLDRFLMNGKALCLMSIDMFVNRVPLGGKLLYKDFQLRLSRAMYS